MSNFIAWLLMVAMMLPNTTEETIKQAELVCKPHQEMNYVTAKGFVVCNDGYEVQMK